MLKKWIAGATFMLIAACSRDASEAVSAIVAADSATPAQKGLVFEQAQRMAPAPASAFAYQAERTDRKTIQTADLRIQLDDVAAATRSADSIAALAQGLVANAHRSQGENGYSEASLTIRVPADKFADALAALRQLGRVRVDNTNAEDVTRSYNDLAIRLAVKRDLVARLRALLTSRTAKLSDLIEVERELARAVTELEQMEGEQRFLDNQIAMSTIRVSFFHAPIAGPGGILDPVTVALREALQVLGRSLATVISVAVFLTPWILITVVAWSLWRFRRRRTHAVAPNT